GTVAKPKDQPIPASVTPIHKKKYTRKSVRLVKDDDELGPSREQEEEPEPEVITRSLSLSELRDMRKDFSHLPGEHIITWLLRCWDNGASSLELEGREAKQLGSLSREGDIDKVIVEKGTDPQPLEATAVKCEGKYNGEWRLTVDYRGLNEVTPPMSAAVPDVLELQYDLESKAAKWYATIDIANAFFSIPLAAECRPQFAFTWKGIQYTWNRLSQGWKHSPTICHGLIQAALEQGEAPEHLQYIDDIIVWGNSAEVVSEKGKKIIQSLLQAGFAIKQSKVKGPAQEIQFLGIRWHDGRHQIPMDIINKTAAMSPPTNKKGNTGLLRHCGFLANARSKLQSHCKPSLPRNLEEE
ncbi:macrophage immunometabolism regulator, partial [Grus japonensis]